MAENTKIEWCDHTQNFWEGCQKVGLGCDHCYAENRNARFGGGVAVNWGPSAPRRRTSAANWRKPLAWNANHAAFFAEHGRRQRVFCSSLSDVFDNEVDPQWRADMMQVIAATPNLDWLLLTKRIGNATKMLDAAVAGGWSAWHNVWIGATVVNQEEADRDIPKLLAVPASKRFLSIEPMLSAIDLSKYINYCEKLVKYGISRRLGGEHIVCDAHCGISWVIAGGESGPGARPMHPDWARSLRDQCAAAGVPFLFKQWGEWVHHTACTVEQIDRCVCIPMPGEPRTDDGMIRVGKKAAGRLLDGIEHNGFPS